MLLGLTQKPAEWTEEQINFLKENADKTKKWVADHMPEPKKSETAVYDMYTVLGILNKKNDTIHKRRTRLHRKPYEHG